VLHGTGDRRCARTNRGITLVAGRRSLAATPVILFITGACIPAGAGLISQKQELDAGRQADRQICSKYRVSDEHAYNGLASHLGKRLLKVCERPDIGWTFRVLDSKEVNAFSVPGYVYVCTGLLRLAGKDQDAVAGVIAHEIGHTTGRHAVKQQEKAMIGGLIGGLIAGRNRTTAQLANLAGSLVLLGHSRGDEYDADRRAVRYTIRAGYDPVGIVRFFEKLKAQEGKQGGGIETYFRTHPPTPDRIKRVRDEIAKERAGDTRRPATSGGESQP
jgi:beta-barrel assembly-enhancing protease